MSKRTAIYSLGGMSGSIADTGAVISKVLKLDRPLDIVAVTFEADTIMADAEDHVVVSLTRVRSTTETKLYEYSFAANSVAWTPVALVAEDVTNGTHLKDGDRLFATVTNETGSAVNPGQWAVHVECQLGLEPATTETGS